MIGFVNAKINIGLSVTERRPDGYHNLETVFYPIGKKSGLPGEPASFCDILEIIPSETTEFISTGNRIDCPLEKNLVFRAVKLYEEELERRSPGKWFPVKVILDKHIPDGAGLGGGSADASFALSMLNDIHGAFSTEELAGMAFRLGADCPFFIYNTPMFGRGAGEVLSPINLDLTGMWIVAVKKNVFVSTKDAFAGITPRRSEFDLRGLPVLPLCDWRKYVRNDFETTVFSRYPELATVKDDLYGQGAFYASMTGSGAVVYGIFTEKDKAATAASYFMEDSTNTNVGLLSL